jgi:hypothetical protein
MADRYRRIGVQAKRRTGRVNKRFFALLAGALAASAPGACTGDGDRQAPPAPPADTASEIPAQATGPTSRPDTLQDTLTLEGNPQPATLRLYRTPPGFPLPFSTYVPADLVPEPVPTAAGGSVRFVANFGGRRTDSAYVAVVVHADGVDEEAARRMLSAATGGGGPAAPDQQRYPWALAEYSGGTGATVSRGILGRHEGQFFQVLIRYPAEFGDGFAPRAAAVLEHWEWEGAGGGLGS